MTATTTEEAVETAREVMAFVDEMGAAPEHRGRYDDRDTERLARAVLALAEALTNKTIERDACAAEMDRAHDENKRLREIAELAGNLRDDYSDAELSMLPSLWRRICEAAGRMRGNRPKPSLPQGPVTK